MGLLLVLGRLVGSQNRWGRPGQLVRRPWLELWELSPPWRGGEVPERGRDEPSRSRDRIGASGAAPAVGMFCLGCWSGWEAEEAREVPPLGLSWSVLPKIIIRYNMN